MEAETEALVELQLGGAVGRDLVRHDRLQPTALVGLRLNIDAPPLLPLPALSRPGTPRSPLRTRACVLPFRTANRPGVCPLRFAERVLLQVPQTGDVGSMWPPGWSEPAGWTVRISPSWRLASAQQGRGPKLCVLRLATDGRGWRRALDRGRLGRAA